MSTITVIDNHFKQQPPATELQQASESTSQIADMLQRSEKMSTFLNSKTGPRLTTLENSQEAEFDRYLNIRLFQERMVKLGVVYNQKLERLGLLAILAQYNQIVTFRRKWHSIRILSLAKSFFGKARG